MVFEHDGIYPIWMKNTRIPLDVLWLDAEGGIVDRAALMPCTSDPCSVRTPSGPARYVLEVNQGVLPKSLRRVDGLVGRVRR
jgi:hypothetical protein